jgi:hypothetical protein
MVLIWPLISWTVADLVVSDPGESEPASHPSRH